jgi:outer membrane receptor protein involved in Fe transport
MQRTSYLLSCALATCALTVALDAVAQSGGGLEEVVVTARKVEESLQDVPISVTAFTSAELEERGLNDIFKLSQFTPGFTFEKLNRFGVQGGGSRPVIRGMSNILGESNAAVLVDGLQFSDSILSFPFDIVERVEVVKGPQAALFGRATFAGAINLITKKGSNEFENRVSTRVADYSDYQVNLLSRGPIKEDKVFYMVHARYYEFGGMYRNSLDNQRIGGEESINFNASLEFRPTENFSARLMAGYGQDDDDAAAITLQDRFSNNCFLDVSRQYFCGEVNPKIESEQNLDLFGDRIGVDKDAFRFAAQLEYDAENFTISSNSGYFTADQTYGYDVDLTANSTALGGTFNRIAVSDREEFSTEVLIRSNADDSRFSWLAGVFYYQSRRDFREDRISPPAPPGATVDNGQDRVDNLAIFGSLGYQFTDSVSGTIELRSARDTIANVPANIASPKSENDYDSISPRLTLDWQVNDESLLYFSAAVGNKPGFINSNPLLDPQFLFADEEESLNFEIGTKNVLNDGRMVMNAAIYTIDWDKQQLTTNTITNLGPASVVVNAGKTKVDGFEFEVTNQFSDAFTAGFTYGLNDAVFKEFDDAEQAAFFGNPSVKGKQTPNSARSQLTMFGRYEWTMRGGMTAFVRADYSWAERKYAQIFNLAHTGDQELLNLRLGFEADKWQVSLFVDNLTDNRAPSTLIRFVDFENFLPVGTSARTSGFVRAFQYPLAPKRQAGIQASYSF